MSASTHIVVCDSIFKISFGVKKHYFWTRVKSSGGEALNLITNVHRPGIKAAGSAGRVDRHVRTRQRKRYSTLAHDEGEASSDASLSIASSKN